MFISMSVLIINIMLCVDEPQLTKLNIVTTRTFRNAKTAECILNPSFRSVGTTAVRTSRLVRGLIDV